MKNFSSEQEPGQKFGSQKILHLHWANGVRNSENISVVEILPSLRATLNNGTVLQQRSPCTYMYAHTHTLMLQTPGPPPLPFS